MANNSSPQVQPSEEYQALNDADRSSRKRARRSTNETVRTFSVQFPNLETLNWISELVQFIGPMIWQDTRLGEARHMTVKACKQLTNGHNDARDLLIKVFGLLQLQLPSISPSKDNFLFGMACLLWFVMDLLFPPISPLQADQKQRLDHWETSNPKHVSPDELRKFKELLNLVSPKTQELNEDYHPFSSSPLEKMSIIHLQLLKKIDNSISSTTKVKACKGTLLFCTSRQLLVSCFFFIPFEFVWKSFSLCSHVFQGFWWGGRKLETDDAILLEGTYPGQCVPTQVVAKITQVYQIATEPKALCWVLVDQQRLKQSARTHSEPHECHIYEHSDKRFFPLGGNHYDWKVLSQIQLLSDPRYGHSQEIIWNTWIWRELSVDGYRPGGHFDRTDSSMLD